MSRSKAITATTVDEAPLTGWWTQVTDWNSTVIWDGPNPVAEGVMTVTQEMADAGQQFSIYVRTAQEAADEGATPVGEQTS